MFLVQCVKVKVKWRSEADLFDRGRSTVYSLLHRVSPTERAERTTGMWRTDPCHRAVHAQPSVCFEGDSGIEVRTLNCVTKKATDLVQLLVE